MKLSQLERGARYDLSIKGPWGMRLDYQGVSYGGLIKRKRPGQDSEAVEVHLFWAGHDPKTGPNPVAAIPSQVVKLTPC